MSQQNNLGQPVREEERVLGISYERAVAMMPRLLRDASRGEPETLGDGYLVSRSELGNAKLEITVRLGRQGADTRFAVRVETLRQMQPQMAALLLVFAILTMGLGLLAFLPYLGRLGRQTARDRDLLIHKTFRAIEDAVAEQDAAVGYRIAPGADAARLEEVANEEDATAERKERTV